MNDKGIVLSALLLIIGTTGRAVSFETALFDARIQTGSSRQTPGTVAIPHPVRFREVPGRGLVLQAWVNGAGPFSFALDTGAGVTLLSNRVAQEAGVRIRSRESTTIAGQSGARTVARNATIESLAIGDRDNDVLAHGAVLVTGGLPRDLDGLLDPTETFSPFGYVIDIPQGELTFFDPKVDPVRLDKQPANGAVVPWLHEPNSRRPFVMLDNGSRALLDTGSSLGLAIHETSTPPGRGPQTEIRDVGGGQVSAHRVAASTVSIGALTLQKVPTDMVWGSEAGAPVLLGLAALHPFRLRFDPLHRLIEIAPGSDNRRRQQQ